MATIFIIVGFRVDLTLLAVAITPSRRKENIGIGKIFA